jgi:hypothetical protein
LLAITLRFDSEKTFLIASQRLETAATAKGM